MAHVLTHDHRQHEVHEPLNEQVVAVLLEHYRTFHAFVAHRVASDAVADDLLQQSLLKACEHPARTREATRILAWFYRILRSTLVDHYRARAAEKNTGAHWVDAVIAQSQTHMPAVDEIQATPCTCFERLLPNLKPGYAELLQRIDLGEESVTTVAQSMGITANNLYVRLHRARQALKQQLARTCGSCTEGGCVHCTCPADDLPVSSTCTV